MLTVTAQAERWPYYAPLLHSTPISNAHFGTKPTVVSITGRLPPAGLIVASDLGRYVARIKADGTVAWLFDAAPEWGPMRIRIRDGQVVFAVGRELVLLAQDTGRVLSRTVIDPARKLLFASPSDGGYLLGFESPLNAEGWPLALPRQIAFWEPRFGIVWELAAPTASARWAEFIAGDKGEVLVADTFNHRVFRANRISGQIDWQFDCYYPNSVHPLPSGEAYVLEEHGNRLLKVALSDARSKVILSAPYALFADPKSTPDQMRKNEARLVGTNPTMAPGLSLAAREYSGQRTLYSPNDLRVTGDLMIIADTDNHRLLGLDSSGRRIIFEVMKLFNPTGVEVAGP